MRLRHKSTAKKGDTVAFGLLHIIILSAHKLIDSEKLYIYRLYFRYANIYFKIV